MVNWLFTLEFKDLLTKGTATAEEYATDAVKNALEAATRIRALMKKVSDAPASLQDQVGDLYIELDEVADFFEDVGKMKPPEGDPQEAFNDALSMLYDLGDRDHRVWVK